MIRPDTDHSTNLTNHYILCCKIFLTTTCSGGGGGSVSPGLPSSYIHPSVWKIFANTASTGFIRTGRLASRPHLQGLLKFKMASYHNLQKNEAAWSGFSATGFWQDNRAILLGTAFPRRELGNNLTKT